MLAPEDSPSFVEDYYDVDVPAYDTVDFPTSPEVFIETKDYFNRIIASLDLGYLATIAVMKEKIIPSTPETGTHTREIWFGNAQHLAAFSTKRLGDTQQEIRYSKFRLEPETIDAIVEIHAISKEIG
ncbi:MAG: hypothetical protein V4611_02785 [Patescibacteria group bacterium]